uniref:Acetylcholinesterase (inferred by orthology to a zebrafish protein) n=1 Tax=Strongyloides venezuelensis TaxID=75913 RepID=A0A0K0F0G2_STRVS
MKLFLLFLLTLVSLFQCANNNKNKDKLVKTPFGRILEKKLRPVWTNTFNATHKVRACPQILRYLDFKDYDNLFPEKGTNECCLKLYMWVPKGKKLPVLVILHDFVSIRTASVDRYYGAYLAQKAKSFDITSNFRLNFFGFAYLGCGKQKSGNMGFLDQQMDLHSH